MASKKVVLAAAIILVMLLSLGVFALYRYGIISASIGLLSTANTATTGSSSGTSVTANTVITSATTTSTSTSSSVLPDTLIGNIGSLFGHLIDAVRGFASSIARNIATGSNIDKVLNGFVYAAVFFIIGKLAESLVKVFKYIMYMLSIFSCIIVVLSLVGIL